LRTVAQRKGGNVHVGVTPSFACLSSSCAAHRAVIGGNKAPTERQFDNFIKRANTYFGNM
jgi:hypothetical protein